MDDPLCEIPVYSLSIKEARKIALSYRTIAVVGLSSRPEKPSHFVSRFLKTQGFRIIPVNPSAKEPILGEIVYPTLAVIPLPVEIVQIFRPAADVPVIVDDAIAIGAKVIWMQEGIVHNEAAKRARSAGLRVVMNLCMMKVLRVA